MDPLACCAFLLVIIIPAEGQMKSLFILKTQRKYETKSKADTQKMKDLMEVTYPNVIYSGFLCVRYDMFRASYSLESNWCVIQGDVPPPGFSISNTAWTYWYQTIIQVDNGNRGQDATDDHASITTTTDWNRSSLLTIPVTTRGNHETRQIILDNNQMHKTSLELPFQVNALAYSSKEKKLFVTVSKPNMIISMYLNDNARSEILVNPVNYSFGGLAVDDDTEFIFVSVTAKYSGINQIMKSGEDFKKIVNASYSSKFYSLALDSHSGYIYVSALDNLFSFSYDGKQQIKRLGKAMYGLVINPQERVLYYGNGKTIFKLSFKHPRRKVIVADLESEIYNIVFYNDTLYISFLKGNDLMALDLKRRTKPTPIQLDYKPGVVVMCAVL